MRKVVTSEELWPFLKPWTVHCAIEEVMRAQGVDLPAPPDVPLRGMGIGATGDGRRVAVAFPDIRYHTHVVGPTGSGKTWLLANMALDVIRARTASVQVVDCKDGELVRNLMQRIPREDWDRVHVIDLRHPKRAVGLNVLEATDSRLRPLVADQVVEVLQQLFPQAWGKRGEHVLRAALLTLLQKPNATICDLPNLLLDARARAYWTRDLDDPIGLGSFWSEFGKLSDSQRHEWTGSVIYKIRDLLLTPEVRHLFGQPRSTIGLRRILDRGEILLVSLPPGEIGRPTTQLVGALLVARIWQSVQARASIAERDRPESVSFLDEFQEVLRMTAAINEVADQARSFHHGLVLAHQNLGQLERQQATQRAVRANVRTKVCFQPQEEDEAQQLTKLYPGLEKEHFMELRSRQVAARLCVGGNAGKAFTAYTQPLPDSDMDAASVRRREEHAAELREVVMERDGRDRNEVEAELRERRVQVMQKAEESGLPEVSWT